MTIINVKPGTNVLLIPNREADDKARMVRGSWIDQSDYYHRVVVDGEMHAYPRAKWLVAIP